MMSQAVPDEPQLRRLEQNATLQDVKKAYRNASLTLHPVGGLTTRLSDEAYFFQIQFSIPEVAHMSVAVTMFIGCAGQEPCSRGCSGV